MHELPVFEYWLRRRCFEHVCGIYARGDTCREYSTVAVDAKIDVCLVGNTKKIWKTFTWSTKGFYIIVDKMVEYEFLFWWAAEATTHSIPPEVRIRCVDNYSYELIKSFDGIMTTYTAFVWTTKADWYIHHRTTSKWENGSMGEHSFLVKTALKM